MPMTFARTQKRYAPLPSPTRARGGQRWPVLLWAMVGAGVCITLLSMLSLLPCVRHCTQEEAGSGAASAWFLCDRLGELEQRPLPELPAPHHHHTPRTGFEPVLAQMGTLVALILLVGRLFVSASHIALRPISAPPTPPPRAA